MYFTNLWSWQNKWIGVTFSHSERDPLDNTFYTEYSNEEVPSSPQFLQQLKEKETITLAIEDLQEAIPTFPSERISLAQLGYW